MYDLLNVQYQSKVTEDFDPNKSFGILQAEYERKSSSESGPDYQMNMTEDFDEKDEDSYYDICYDVNEKKYKKKYEKKYKKKIHKLKKKYKKKYKEKYKLLKNNNGPEHQDTLSYSKNDTEKYEEKLLILHAEK